MQPAVLFPRGEDGPIDVFADSKRPSQRERARNVRLAVKFRKLGTRKLNVVLIPDRNAVSPQVAAIRAGDLDRNGQLGAGIDLARRDLYRARAPTVRAARRRRHDVNAIL